MLLKCGLILLVAWAVGVVGFSDSGPVIHLLLLVSLMLLLLVFVRARDVRALPPGTHDPSRPH